VTGRRASGRGYRRPSVVPASRCLGRLVLVALVLVGEAACRADADGIEQLEDVGCGSLREQPISKTLQLEHRGGLGPLGEVALVLVIHGRVPLLADCI
jgi:hypothetical protein